jgi:group I intron endonuclease
MNIFAVYIVTNKLNGKQYIGIAKNLQRRWKQHFRINGSSPALHSALKKYGKESFVFTHICDAFNFESACDIEKMLIKQHNTKSPNGYNLTDGGEGTNGFLFTEESKQKMRESAKGQKRSKESNIKRSISLLNNKNSLGHVHSEETKQKMSKARIGKKHTDEAKAKMKAAKAILKAKKMAIKDTV